ncbi:MAG: hypothetical protein HN704_14355 [Bacteroidetes bacterium]|jgi:peptidyl-prolyl cis-trans isomerase SurA|nr:hypothetical protein [Bacteroidota bacterium]MBT6686270.1 hypothetical protein [Bacteroidota bacterium]MBT7142636.1 hypothetical protein [Bacteroidota bacterium]MBT7492778.1 hypothetical protein [Bacteroidota bacterium]
MKNLVQKISILSILTLVIISSACKTEEILLQIDNKKVPKAEFIRIYEKNNSSENKIDNKSIDEYLDLFTNFKLKVTEAENLGLDTTQAFVSELAGYRNQLSKPYLVDENVDQELVKEAYNRLKSDINASHILIKLGPNPSSEDTLKAYNKTLEIRERLLTGEDFEKLAKEFSDDPSAKSNGGDLNYFTGFQMVYPFESAAYQTKLGEISMPVRTRFGYHLIKVKDIRPARGKVQVAHIMIALPKNSPVNEVANAKKKIDNIYQEILEGKDFGEMAEKKSDDKSSAMKGGVMPMFGTGRMVPEFEQAAFNLKEIGDISKPVKTAFGWHLIKLVDKKGLAPIEEMEAEIKSKIAKDARSKQSRKVLINRLKIEYKLVENEESLTAFYTTLDSSILIGKWDGKSAEHLNNMLFSINKKKILQSDFTDYLVKKKSNERKTNFKDLVNKKYQLFVDEKILEYEEENLENKYQEFRLLMNEYHDGILLFELTDKMVWSKAVKDTSGLKEFFSNNGDKYSWNERVDASIYSIEIQAIDSVKISDSEFKAIYKNIVDKARKIAANRNRTAVCLDSAISLIKSNFNENVKLYVSLNEKKYSKGEKDIIDQISWKPGLSENIEKDGLVKFIFIYEVLEPEPKNLKEAKGIVTADYQNFLEEEWIKNLRNKYKIKVNEKVLETMK